MDIDTMPAGREMDRLIALLMGWKGVGPNATGQWGGVNPNAGDPQEWYHLPHYSTDIADAWLVVEEVKDNGSRGFDIQYVADREPPDRPYWYAGYAGYGDHGEREIGWNGSEGETAPLAICRAVLKATGYPG